MPEMDGVTLALETRKLRPSVPLIMLTSLGRREVGVPGDLFAAYLSKPIKASQLYDAALTVLARSTPVLLRRRASDAQSQPEMAGQFPLHILLAEDNSINQQVALHMLAQLGYRADLAANGLEVLDALRRQEYDRVLMDIQMPEIDGDEATRQIRAELLGSVEPQRQPRIVALTADAMGATASVSWPRAWTTIRESTLSQQAPAHGATSRGAAQGQCGGTRGLIRSGMPHGSGASAVTGLTKTRTGGGESICALSSSP